MTHEIVQLQRKRDSSHIFLPVNKNIVNIDINKHEVEKNHKHNASMYTINTVASDDNDNDIIEHAIKTNNTSHNTQYSHSMFQRSRSRMRLTSNSKPSLIKQKQQQQQQSHNSIK